MSDLFDKLFMVNFEAEHNRPIDELLLMTQKQYLAIVKAKENMSLGMADSASPEPFAHQVDHQDDDFEQADATVTGVRQEAYDKYSKKPQLLYPQEESIVCGYCGYTGKSLKRHLGSAHGVAASFYLNEFCLPPQMPLACHNLLNAGKERMNKYWDSPKGQARKAKAAEKHEAMEGQALGSATV